LFVRLFSTVHTQREPALTKMSRQTKPLSSTELKMKRSKRSSWSLNYIRRASLPLVQNGRKKLKGRKKKDLSYLTLMHLQCMYMAVSPSICYR
jgi:hypothetical protein